MKRLLSVFTIFFKSLRLANSALYPANKLSDIKKIEPYFYEGRRLEYNNDMIHDFLEFSGTLPWEG